MSAQKNVGTRRTNIDLTSTFVRKNNTPGTENIRFDVHFSPRQGKVVNQAEVQLVLQENNSTQGGKSEFNDLPLP